MVAHLLTRESWLRENGFKRDPKIDIAQDPFQRYAYHAESDPRRGDCFTEFPYYSEVKGTASSPGPVLITARRGGGKSALRCQIAAELENSLKQSMRERYLTVVYQDFEHASVSSGDKASPITLRTHVENIVGLIVARLFDLSLEKPSIVAFKHLTKDQKWLLLWYINHFARHLHYREVNERLGRLFGLGYYVNAENVIKVLLGIIKATPTAKESLGSLADVLTTWPMREAQPSDISTRDLLFDLMDIYKACGIDAAYVLIDGLDSAEPQGNEDDFQSALRVIQPLCSTPALYLHQTPGLIIKIFAPEEIWRFLKEKYRRDLGVQHVEWQSPDDEGNLPLLRIWRQRLEVYSNGLYASLSPLFEGQSRPDIDTRIMQTAQTPRELLVLGDAMLAHHFRYETDNPLLNEKDWLYAVSQLKETQSTPMPEANSPEEESIECAHLRDVLEKAKCILDELEMQQAGYTNLTFPAHLRIELKDQRERVDRLTREYREKCSGLQKE